MVILAWLTWLGSNLNFLRNSSLGPRDLENNPNTVLTALVYSRAPNEICGMMRPMLSVVSSFSTLPNVCCSSLIESVGVDLGWPPTLMPPCRSRLRKTTRSRSPAANRPAAASNSTPNRGHITLSRLLGRDQKTARSEMCGEKPFLAEICLNGEGWDGEST